MSRQFLISHSANGIVDYGIEHASVAYHRSVIAGETGTLTIPDGATSYLFWMTPGATVWVSPDAIVAPTGAWTATRAHPNPGKLSLDPSWTALNYRATNAAEVWVAFFFPGE